MSAAEDFREEVGTRKFATVLADPLWRFHNKTGKVAPEHKRLARYPTLTFEEIENLPVRDAVEETAHLYLWVPNALLTEGLQVMKRWGFQYKTNLIWYKVRQDGGPDRRGVGFYFRNVTEMVPFGVRGKKEAKCALRPFQIELLERSALRNEGTDENRCIKDDDHEPTLLRHPPRPGFPAGRTDRYGPAYV